MQIVAWHNQKGGVGKTATTINVGAAIAELGRRVLLVDFDPQGHLTDALGISEPTGAATMPNALLGRWSGELRELIVPYRERLHVLPTHEEMFLLEPQLYPVAGREWRLSTLLDAMAKAYDVCMIDCPPSLGALTDNALVAARKGRGGIAIPVQSEDSSLKALKLLFRQLDSLQTGLRIEVDTLGLAINLYDGRRGKVVTSTRASLEKLGAPILGVVGDRTVVREAWRVHQPVVEHAPESEAAGWYRDLAKAALARLDGSA